ncbi:response regulator transcription factor [Amycolatopsis sp. NPDC004169]|uniref:response regulator transcription factor n=1 Tax=Amycolatopsis sp. NPDC004169 TaxID=3154453 RepID=UPI0033A50854
MTEPLRVFLLDDHEVVRRGIRDLLEGEPDIVVAGEAATASEALTRVPTVRPHVAILDVRLGESTNAHGDRGGVEVCRQLRSRMPELACLMLTSFDDDEAQFDAVMAGAAGYVLKQVRGADLVSAVRTVASGRSLFAPRKVSQVRTRPPGPPPSGTHDGSPLDVLSPRELEILGLISEGLTNRQIAKRLFLSEKTVKNRVSSILNKLGVRRRVQAALLTCRLHQTGTE